MDFSGSNNVWLGSYLKGWVLALLGLYGLELKLIWVFFPIVTKVLDNGEVKEVNICGLHILAIKYFPIYLDWPYPCVLYLKGLLYRRRVGDDCRHGDTWGIGLVVQTHLVGWYYNGTTWYGNAHWELDWRQPFHFGYYLIIKFATYIVVDGYWDWDLWMRREVSECWIEYYSNSFVVRKEVSLFFFQFLSGSKGSSSCRWELSCLFMFIW